MVVLHVIVNFFVTKLPDMAKIYVSEIIVFLL